MKKRVKKSKNQNKKEQKPKRKTNLRIVLTAIVALGFIALAFWNWLFILPAVFLWWINKRYIKKHFDV